MFFWVFQKQIYTLIILSPKFCSFLCILATSCCTFFYTRNVIEISVYCNAQNIIHSHVFLLQITEFGSSHVSCLKALKLLLRLFWNRTNGSPVFSLFSLKEIIKCTKTYETYVRSLHFWRNGSKATNHSDSHIIPTYIVHNQISSHLHHEPGIRCPKGLYLVGFAWI